MKGRILLGLGLTIAALLSAAAVARAQDAVTNLDQISAAFDQPGLDCPLAMPYEPNWLQPMDILFLDFTSLPDAVAAITNYPAQTQNEVPVWVLRLIQSAETGEVVLKPSGVDVELLRIDGPPSFVPFQAYNRVLRSYCLLFLGENSASYEDLIAEGDTFLNPPRTVADVLVVRAEDEDAFCSYGSTSAASSMFTAMAEDEGGGGDVGIDALGGGPCSVTNLTQQFFVSDVHQETNHYTTITWPSCPIFRYLVLSADELDTNTAWSAQAHTSYVWGRANASSTSWTDASTADTNVTQRFYRVQRILGSPIAAGGYHSLALKTDRTLWDWGGNDYHQLGDGGSADRSLPINIAIVSNVCYAGGVTNAVALAAGYNFSVAVDATGRVWTWGDNSLGQLGNGTHDETNAPSRINGVSNVVSVAAGDLHTLALRADGAVFAWGANGDGQLGIGDLPVSSTNSPVQTMMLTQIVAVAAGGFHSVALGASGNVWTWGRGVNAFGDGGGQLGNGGTANVTTPAVLTGISNVIAIAAGGFHTVALTADKRVWTWGDNSSGELGRDTGTLTYGPLPGSVSGLSNVVVIAGGLDFSLAVITNGQMYAWGNNDFGQLGTNGLASTNTPIVVAGISNAVLVSAHPAGGHSLAVTTQQGTNQYWAWGDDTYGQVGNGTNGINQYAPSQIQFSNSCMECIQLGTNGTFTAPCTGTLKLYFNDDGYGDNGGSYTATVSGVASQVIVQGTNNQGVAIGTVTKGTNYTYSASGFIVWDTQNHQTDANGNNPDGILIDCDAAHGSTHYNNEGRCGGFPCPNAICYSLVGKIQ